MADMEARVELNVLLDFYGPLLTPHRQEILRLYCEEDLSHQEIAEQLGITRQGVHDAIEKSRRQLAEYEATLGLVSRHRRERAQIGRCLELADRIVPDENSGGALEALRAELERLMAPGAGQGDALP